MTDHHDARQELEQGLRRAGRLLGIDEQRLVDALQIPTDHRGQGALEGALAEHFGRVLTGSGARLQAVRPVWWRWSTHFPHGTCLVALRAALGQGAGGPLAPATEVVIKVAVEIRQAGRGHRVQVVAPDDLADLAEAAPGAAGRAELLGLLAAGRWETLEVDERVAIDGDARQLEELLRRWVARMGRDTVRARTGGRVAVEELLAGEDARFSAVEPWRGRPTAHDWGTDHDVWAWLAQLPGLLAGAERLRRCPTTLGALAEGWQGSMAELLAAADRLEEPTGR